GRSSPTRAILGKVVLRQRTQHLSEADADPRALNAQFGCAVFSFRRQSIWSQTDMQTGDASSEMVTASWADDPGFIRPRSRGRRSIHWNVEDECIKINRRSTVVQNPAPGR